MNTTPHQSSAEEDELSNKLFWLVVDAKCKSLDCTRQEYMQIWNAEAIEAEIAPTLDYLAARDRTKAQELLARVEAELVGEDEPVDESPCCDGECGGMTFAEYDHLFGAAIVRNAKRAEWRTTLAKIREEYDVNS